MRDVIRRESLVAQADMIEPTGAEQRRAPRVTMLIRAAKLICPQGEFLCVIRDASDTGLNLRLFHNLPPEDRFLLELQNGDQHEVEVVWMDDDRAGVRFVQIAEIARIVESPSRFSKRPIRINIEFPVELSGLGGAAKATLLDLSQQGAKIRSDARFAIDQRVTVHSPYLPEVNAKVRWRRDDSYGLVFEDTFQFGDLARIVAEIQMGKAD